MASVTQVGEAYVKLTARDQTQQGFTNVKQRLTQLKPQLDGVGSSISGLRGAFGDLGGALGGTSESIASFVGGLLEVGTTGAALGVVAVGINYIADGFEEMSQRAEVSAAFVKKARDASADLRSGLVDLRSEIDHANAAFSAGTAADRWGSVLQRTTELVDNAKASYTELAREYNATRESATAFGVGLEQISVWIVGGELELKRMNRQLDLLRDRARDAMDELDRIEALELQARFADAIDELNRDVELRDEADAIARAFGLTREQTQGIAAELLDAHATAIRLREQFQGTDREADATAAAVGLMERKIADARDRATELATIERQRIEDYRAQGLAAIEAVDRRMQAAAGFAGFEQQQATLRQQLAAALAAIDDPDGDVPREQAEQRVEAIRQRMTALADERRAIEETTRIRAAYADQIREVQAILDDEQARLDETDRTNLQARIRLLEQDRDDAIARADAARRAEFAARDRIAELQATRDTARDRLADAQRIDERRAEISSLEAIRQRLAAGGATGDLNDDRKRAIAAAEEGVELAEKQLRVQQELLAAAKNEGQQAVTVEFNG